MNEFEIVDNYGYKEDYLKPLLLKALKKLDINNVHFNVILTNDEEIKIMNKEYRDKDEATDVLSFALSDSIILDIPVNMLGDIYISIDRMKHQAKEYATGEKRELSFLTIHGLLHLLGYDHETKEEEKEMFELQEKILKEC